MSDFQIKGGQEMGRISISGEASQITGCRPINGSCSTTRKIQKVTSLLRQDEHNKTEYDPKVVSLGPYHHGKPELKLAEEFNTQALEMFVSGSYNNIDFFYDKVLEVVDDARNCYVRGSTDAYDDAAFARMMLLDACFFINHIEISLSDKSGKDHATREHIGMLVLATTLQDMLLLENQIPFWILKLLITLRYNRSKADELLSNFSSYVLSGEYKQKEKMPEDDEEPIHFLDALRRLLVSECSEVNQTFHSSKLESVRKRSRRPTDERNVKKSVHSFRSVTELKAKGICFRPSSTDSLKDIKFQSFHFFGQLELPTSCVSIYTKVFYLNLIAYELCPNNVTDSAVSAYINFMKSLIESPRDVKELREKLILFNMLGSDEEVAKVYKELNTYGVNNVQIFQDVREKIQKHYDSRAKTWIAELNHSQSMECCCFANCLQLLFFVLCSTFMQTYFTINPSIKK